jgi:hypothetical protein
MDQQVSWSQPVFRLYQHQRGSFELVTMPVRVAGRTLSI